ncbi:MAG: LysR family transcriptional regulator, partial [Phyllobacterium sp.]|uniref:LysR family transcriptional regulator n=1 Tax=Phyllobacterium sp. TaxID=1871046 RepID=UPI0030F0FACD
MNLRRKLPPLTALTAFEAAARLASFTKAANELGVTQAAVSRQIHLLEEQFGFPLFVRFHRKIELTEKG